MLSRNNGTGFGTQLVKINITAGPFAPEDGGGDTGIASALAMAGDASADALDDSPSVSSIGRLVALTPRHAATSFFIDVPSGATEFASLLQSGARQSPDSQVHAGQSVDFAEEATTLDDDLLAMLVALRY